MKIWKILFTVFVISQLFMPFVMAHPGSTDSSGCHTQSSTGTRHCHGIPDNPDRNSPTGNYTGEWDTYNPQDSQSESTDLLYVIIASIFAAPAVFVLLGSISLPTIFAKNKKD